MAQTYEYYQPEYFSKFKCDGQKCNAHCCRYCFIDIDKKTYKKYSHLKPKSAAQEIIRNLKKLDGSDDYFIKLDENFSCPFLTDDNLCNIQRRHGEDFLSITCITYPRVRFNFEYFCESTLTLSCPVAAELILFAEEPVKLEKVEVSEKTHKYFQSLVMSRRKVPEGLYGKFIMIQETEMFILQERTLTLDQRLMMLGLYIDRIDELWKDISLFGEIDKVSAFYQNSNFLQEQVAQFSPVITFHSLDYMKAIMELLGTLYSSGKIPTPNDRKILDSLMHMLKFKMNANHQVEIEPLAERYMELGGEREKFLQQFNPAFENYLVNELIFNVVPFMIEGTSMTYSYGIFVTLYKMFEILAFAVAMEGNSSREDFLEVVTFYVGTINNSQRYFPKVAEYIDDKCDLVKIMQNFLQV